MKRKLQLLTFVFCLLGAISVAAQDTFDAKKHKSGKTAKMGNVKKFKTFKSVTAKKNRKRTTGRTDFQMPSVFNLGSVPSRYKHRVVEKSENGLPLFIKSTANEATAKMTSKQSVETVGKEYLADIGPLLRIKDPVDEFVETSRKKDVLGQTHIKMQQVFQGVKVHGSQVVLHLDKSNRVISLNGRNRPSPVLKSTVPKVSVADALKWVESDLGVAIPRGNSAKGNDFLPTSGYEEELLIYAFKGKDVLVRHITAFPNVMDRWEYFVDAQTGTILDKYHHTCTLFHGRHEGVFKHKSAANPPENGNGTDLNGINRQLNTFSVNGTNYLVNTSKPMFDAARSQMPDNPIGGIMTLDLRNEPPVEGSDLFHVTSTNNNWNNPIAVSAHYNADVSYEYFRNTFGRNSINGEGGTIISIINVADPDTGGGLDNAFWNGRAMFYGNGDFAFSPLAGALDVAGHEMSHGVIENTANLEYRYQSGAINESFADIFGAMIDREDWQLAEDVVNREVFPSGAMRDMQNPNNGRTQLGEIGWQPKDMTEYYDGDENNGGVHINSGIANRAFYLVANTIGRDKAEQIYYRALDTYLTVSSQFIDLRLAVIQSATDLHGENSAEVLAIQNAYDTVGITDGAPTDTENDIPVAEGDDFILSVDVRDSDPNTLYISDTQATEYFPLTTTRLFRKPSVSDDGSLAIYVTEDNKVNAVTLNPNNPEETVISEESIWAAVALSKDGTKLAAVFNDESNLIVISDLVSGDFREFELYNPTTSNDGTTTGDVLYPDALEWDYSGQYLIYDALNLLENAQGEDIEYWDVGALRVWNNESNTFGDGAIQKIFTNLPEGVSIGNPSFSKTSGNILAFDYWDMLNNEYEVITANIETGEVKTVYQNNKLGFPNYSKNDDKMIFDTDNNGTDVIAVIDMAGDKISPSGNASELIPDGKWGIWYTVGERSTLSNQKEITDFRFNVTAPPTVGVINGTTITVDLPNIINPENLVATFSSSARSTVSIAGVEQLSGVTVNDFSNGVVYTVMAEDGSTKNFTVDLGESIPNDPNDEDNDGVPNANDQCPGTPNGATVDVTGCETFSLPANNFQILAKGESCIDSNNGSISIEAAENYNYTATLIGNGANLSNDFIDSVVFNDLAGGVYTVCISVAGQPEYESCFEVTVARPEALSVSSKVDLTAKTVTLQLSGANQYAIALNDEVMVTKKSEVTIPLKTSDVKLSVTTDKECQGVYEEHIGLENRIIVYPNPVSSGEITVELGKICERPIPIVLSTFDGRTVLQKKSPPNSNTVKLDAENLAAGIYLLSLKIDGTTKTFKIVKQ